MDYKNYVIEVLDKEHGKKVKQHFIDLGFDKEVSDYKFYLNRKDLNYNRFYGFKNGHFGNYSANEIGDKENIVHTLPEERQYPKVMLVSINYGKNWLKRVVFMEKKGRFISWANAESLEASEDVIETDSWGMAKDLPAPTKVTRADIAKALGVDEFEIID